MGRVGRRSRRKSAAVVSGQLIEPLGQHGPFAILAVFHRTRPLTGPCHRSCSGLAPVRPDRRPPPRERSWRRQKSHGGRSCVVNNRGSVAPIIEFDQQHAVRQQGKCCDVPDEPHPKPKAGSDDDQRIADHQRTCGAVGNQQYVEQRQRVERSPGVAGGKRPAPPLQQVLADNRGDDPQRNDRDTALWKLLSWCGR